MRCTGFPYIFVESNIRHCFFDLMKLHKRLWQWTQILFTRTVSFITNRGYPDSETSRFFKQRCHNRVDLGLATAFCIPRVGRLGPLGSTNFGKGIAGTPVLCIVCVLTITTHHLTVTITFILACDWKGSVRGRKRLHVQGFLPDWSAPEEGPGQEQQGHSEKRASRCGLCQSEAHAESLRR